MGPMGGKDKGVLEAFARLLTVSQINHLLAHLAVYFTPSSRLIPFTILSRTRRPLVLLHSRDYPDALYPYPFSITSRLVSG